MDLNQAKISNILSNRVYYVKDKLILKKTEKSCIRLGIEPRTLWYLLWNSYHLSHQTPWYQKVLGSIPSQIPDFTVFFVSNALMPIYHNNILHRSLCNNSSLRITSTITRYLYWREWNLNSSELNHMLCLQTQL